MIIVHYVPIYWGIERRAPDRSFVTRSTLHEVMPPFRQSDWAFRIRVSPWHWLHIGRYHHDPEVRRWGMDASVDEISTWRGPNAVGEEQANGEQGTDEVRPAVGDSADRLSGSGDAPDGGTVQGVQPQRVGQGLGGSADGVSSADGAAGN